MPGPVSAVAYAKNSSGTVIGPVISFDWREGEVTIAEVVAGQTVMVTREVSSGKPASTMALYFGYSSYGDCSTTPYVDDRRAMPGVFFVNNNTVYQVASTTGSVSVVETRPLTTSSYGTSACQSTGVRSIVGKRVTTIGLVAQHQGPLSFYYP